MKFLGREKEILVLEKEYARDGGFVVLYGRRRIGKTTLIKQFIKSKNARIGHTDRKSELGGRAYGKRESAHAGGGSGGG